MNSKCLCGYCAKNNLRNDHPSTSTGKKEPKICPVAFICESRHCTCEFCRLPSLNKEYPFTNHVLYIMYRQVEGAENQFLKYKVMHEINVMMKKCNEIIKIQDEEAKKQNKKSVIKKKKLNMCA